MLLFWGSLLCWGLLPQAHGEAQHLLFLRISKDQVETDISDLLSEHRILDRVARIPVTGATGEGIAILGHLPFVKKSLSRKSSGLDLSLVGDLLAGKSLPLLGQLLRAEDTTHTLHRSLTRLCHLHPSHRLIIEDAKGPEVTLQVLSDSLLQVTLRCKLYLSLQRILRLKVIKNIRMGIRLEQTGNKTQVAFEECHTPPGYLSITVLERMNFLLVNEALGMVTRVLDQALPFLLQKIVCPLATTLLSSLLEDLLHIHLCMLVQAPLLSLCWEAECQIPFLTVARALSGPEDFRYYVTTTEFTEDAILMKVLLVTRCGPGQRAPRLDLLAPQDLPKLAQGSMADLAFRVDAYNDILSCLYASKEVCVDPRDPTAAYLIQLLSLRGLDPRPKLGAEESHRLGLPTPLRFDFILAFEQSPGRMGLAIRTPEPPTVHLDGHRATVIQQGSLMLLRPNGTPSVSVFWKLLSKAMFSSRNQNLKLQFTPYSTMVTLSTYPAGLAKQKERLKAFVSELLRRVFLPRHNGLHAADHSRGIGSCRGSLHSATRAPDPGDSKNGYSHSGKSQLQ
ncbi:uncharacterized protein LOC118707946 [Pipistrellus kuhlii]|uniref:uncharacterized protein LOC118707946 n=1 Tax=Pipistrellus kuhlii TaxID=59472 RepID=UPI001E26EDB2|nr:uncharacterized protein LOC118707946 [Pipistrellus kuhlii]